MSHNSCKSISLLYINFCSIKFWKFWKFFHLSWDPWAQSLNYVTCWAKESQFAKSISQKHKEIHQQYRSLISLHMCVGCMRAYKLWHVHHCIHARVQSIVAHACLHEHVYSCSSWHACKGYCSNVTESLPWYVHDMWQLCLIFLNYQDKLCPGKQTVLLLFYLFGGHHHCRHEWSLATRTVKDFNLLICTFYHTQFTAYKNLQVLLYMHAETATYKLTADHTQSN